MKKLIILGALALAAALFAAPAFAQSPQTPQRAEHFDAVDQCGPHGVNEWATYYGTDGRLHIEIWCLGDDGLEEQLMSAGYPSGDFRCTLDYQHWTNREFFEDDAPNCPSLRRATPQASRANLCRQEIVNVREGLIGTAPGPGEEGISETNPTPACRTHWVTLAEICPFVDADPGETTLVTDEIHEPLVCPQEPDETRRLLCTGPRDIIPDNDPGLALYPNGTLEDRQITLADNRINACDPEENTP